MFKKILLALGLIFIPYTSHALDVTILNTVVPVSCYLYLILHML
jgi:hypothetical protein